MAYPWANGRVPADQLRNFAGRPLHVTAAIDAQLLSNALRASGHPALTMGTDPASGYRQYADQLRLFKQLGWPKAARPGTSNHGLGVAADFGAPYNYRGVHHSALVALAGAYGWRWAGGTFNVVEPWHFEHPSLVVSGIARIIKHTVKDVQRLVGVAADGGYGVATIRAVTVWQQRNGLTADGIFGPACEAKAWGGSAPAQPSQPAAQPAKTGHATVNPFDIDWCAGLQKIARMYGYTGAIDGNFGAGSMTGFAAFLRKNWGYSGNDVLGPAMWAAIARWLRAKYGYVGNDVPGPSMRAALSRAENANFRALP